MALQSLTTTLAPSGTETVAPKPGPQDTNANGSLLGQPLVPAFVLSGLLVVGIVMMCWWKRIAARRMFLRLNASVGEGTTTPGMGEGEGGGSTGRGYAYPYPGPRATLMIGPGRVMGPGMLLLATRGADLQAEALALHALGGPAGGRKKEVKLGPKPVLWDVHLGENEEGEEKAKGERWRWDDMKPLSASYVSPQSLPDIHRQARTRVSYLNPTAASPSTDESQTRTRWLRRHRADVPPAAEAPKKPERQPESSSPPPPKVRISMLISMPTGEAARRARPGRTEDFECNLKAGSKVGIGELNLALGITEVEERKESEL